MTDVALTLDPPVIISVPDAVPILKATPCFYYLATPYSKFPGGINAAFIAACHVGAELIRAGVRVYSPITHTHPIAVHGGIDPYDHGIWLPADKPFMDGACGMIVATLPTWDQSFGIGEEIKEFKKAGKPIVYIKPGPVPRRKRVKAADIIGTALGFVTGDRHKTHGDKTENHQNIASLWNAYLGWRLVEGGYLTPRDAALMMCLLKIARTKLGAHNPDDYIDLSGYAGVAGEIAENELVDAGDSV